MPTSILRVLAVTAKEAPLQIGTSPQQPSLPRRQPGTRVHNQRRTSSFVTGLCEHLAMGNLFGYPDVSTADQF
jgi:hypothetical protein